VGSYELLMVLVRSSARVPAIEPDSIRVPDSVPAADPLLVQAADVFAGVVPSIRAIRSALHVGQPRAQEIQAYLADRHSGTTTRAAYVGQT
jgi:hypothetical protein